MGTALRHGIGARPNTGRYLPHDVIRLPAAILASFVVLALLWGCAATPVPKHGAAPHPLLGRIWDVRNARMVGQDAVARELATAPLILLGEVHDNPEHHRLQGEMLRAVLAQGRQPALAMEQFDREYQPALDAAAQQPGLSADALATAGHFNREGWDWPLYEPLLAAAVAARLPVVAINLPRDRTREVARQGFDALGPTAERDLALDRTWNPARAAIMDREIADGHCGKLPPAALPRMVNVQRAKDATMADAIIGRAGAGVVVIAGAEHVRNDVGVPVYLAARAPGSRVVTIGFTEVDPDLTGVTDYIRPAAAGLPFDYVWFTAPAERDDPCAGLVMPNRP